MKSSFLLLADYVQQSTEGKLTISGVFDVIFTPSAPARHPQMFVVTRLETQGLVPESHELSVAILNADGKNVAGFPLTATAPFGPSGIPGTIFAQFIFRLDGLLLPEFGTYRVVVYVDGAQIDERPLRLVVMALDQQQPPVVQGGAPTGPLH